MTQVSDNFASGIGGWTVAGAGSFVATSDGSGGFTLNDAAGFSFMRRALHTATGSVDGATNSLEILVEWEYRAGETTYDVDYMSVILCGQSNDGTTWAGYGYGPVGTTDMSITTLGSGGSSSATLGSQTLGFTLTTGVRYLSRFRRETSGIFKAKTWRKTTDSEPGSWQITTSADTTYTSGYVGVGGYEGGAEKARAFIGIGINDVAPDPSGGSSSPTITDVDTDEDVYDGQSNVAITGTNLSGATFDLVDGSITSSQNVDSTTSTTAQIDISMGNCRYGTRTLSATVGADTGTISITLSTPSGKSYINIGTPNTTAANRITAVGDLASGDQLEISNVVGGVIGDVTINADATFDVAIGVTAFDVRVNDGTGWGTVGTQTMLNGAAAGVGVSNYLKVPKRRRNGGLAWALTSSEWF